MDLQLNGKTALVTGGTRGIGRAIVEAFAAEGANVAFCARNKAEITATETALAGTGVKVEGAVLDVGDGDAVAAWVDAVAGRFGGLDAVVSNVSALAIDDSAESWEACLRVDLMGTVRLMQAAVPHVGRSESPSLVAISSVSGREVDFASGPYGTVKSALIAYMAGLAFQLAGTGIRANTVSPGNTYHDGGVWQSMERNSPEMFASSMALNPTGRMGSAQEVADVVVFVSSPRASRMTGANVLADGALSRGIQF
ncbi:MULTISPECIES: SDR family NAD(P)-dependent oxidoreductase [unclassified Arthrobacter]|uniref:SDR family NAD(P)-dependent oxidoreductase n=1 Tax=unclassified Arthrobacter TaxID=235627 RepID=UPI001D139F7A|nr:MULTISPECIES: SDR family oxidoreductase [unclassified Arthrobacter]MCC3289808.1 SDR family oxidoreductase [Arthrobacter sp. zg-Y1110]MCC3300690.1 SDR family oxidoreductase [Arthrobacter sp. zg-Y895]UWX84775.1 SDR family oxidoreductase [Arthrobacter sp. zg-Y1110]